MEEYSEDNRKHLDYLQALITRMNSNSFQLKVTSSAHNVSDSSWSNVAEFTYP